MASYEDYGNSDELLDFSCTPCSNDGKQVEAEQYCVQCEGYFCLPCLKQHNRIPVLKSHLLLDKDSWTDEPSSPSFDKCDNHQAVMDLYCEQHDYIACRTCWSIEHSDCKAVFIPTLIQDDAYKANVGNVGHNLQTLHTSLNKTRRSRSDDLSRVKDEETKIISGIKDLRRQLIKRVDTMTQSSIDNVQAISKRIQTTVNTDVRKLDKLITSLDSQQQALKDSETFTETQHFIHARQCKKVITMGNEVAKTCKKNVGLEGLNFKLNKDIENNLKTLDSLGYCYNKETNLRQGTDEAICSVTSSCQLDDGTFVLVDNANNKIKLLNKTYAVTEYICLGGGPYAVCSTGPKEIAVSLFEKEAVQILNLKGKMTPTSTLPVGAKCYGLAYVATDSELYVVCDTHQGGGKGSSHIKVFNTKGKCIRTVENDSSGKPVFFHPRNIIISSDRVNLLVTDTENGLIILNKQGTVMSTFNDPKLEAPIGVCIKNKHEVLLSGNSSDNVIKVGINGRGLGEVLNRSNGLRKPRSLCYDSNAHRIIISMDNCDVIRVFDFE